MTDAKPQIHVQRDAEGAITGLYSGPQIQEDGRDLCQPDTMDDDHPEVMAFREYHTLGSRRRTAPPEAGEGTQGVSVQAPPADGLGAGVPSPEERADDDVPNAWRSLLIDGESPAKFTERMRLRMRALRHYRGDSLKPSELRSLPDMSEEESIELDDLEERNRLFKLD